MIDNHPLILHSGFMNIWDLADPSLEKLQPYPSGPSIEEVAKNLGTEPEKIIKLDSNENPFGPSPTTLDAMHDALGKAHLYPDGGARLLTQTIARHHQIDPSHVIIGNGSSEIIQLIFHAFIRDGHLTTHRHAFIIPSLTAQLFGASTFYARENDYTVDLDHLLKAIRIDTHLLYLANPNNPTGTMVDNQQLDQFIANVPGNVILVLDEAYIDYPNYPPSTIRWIQNHQNLVILRTFSNLHALAGLRIGYALAHPDTATILRKTRQLFNTNHIAQIAGAASLEDFSYHKKAIQHNDKERQRFEQFCQSLKIPYIPSQANFVTLNVGNAREIFDKLLQQGIIVRTLEAYEMPEYIRVTIGTSEQMDQFYSVLKRIYGAKTLRI